MTQHGTESRLARCYDHVWRIKSAIFLLVLSGWYVTAHEPTAMQEPTRWWITANVTWKLSLAVILFHIGRHDNFGYLRLGLVVKDYRDSMASRNGLSSCAAAIMALAICILYGLAFAALVGVLGKY